MSALRFLEVDQLIIYPLLAVPYFRLHALAVIDDAGIGRSWSLSGGIEERNVPDPGLERRVQAYFDGGGLVQVRFLT